MYNIDFHIDTYLILFNKLTRHSGNRSLNKMKPFKRLCTIRWHFIDGCHVKEEHVYCKTIGNFARPVGSAFINIKMHTKTYKYFKTLYGVSKHLTFKVCLKTLRQYNRLF